MNKKKIFITCMTLIGIFICIAGYLVYHFTWDTQSVPKGELLKVATSPKGTYKANVYSGTGGATDDFAVLVEIENNKTKEKKNIFWENHCEDATVQWISENIIRINDRELNIKKDVYDFRHEDEPVLGKRDIHEHSKSIQLDLNQAYSMYPKIEEYNHKDRGETVKMYPKKSGIMVLKIESDKECVVKYNGQRHSAFSDEKIYAIKVRKGECVSIKLGAKIETVEIEHQLIADKGKNLCEGDMHTVLSRTVFFSQGD